MPSLFYWLSFCQLFLQFFYLPVRKSSLSFHVFSFNCLYPLLSLCFVYYTGLAFLSLFVGFVFILCLSLSREMHLCYLIFLTSSSFHFHFPLLFSLWLHYPLCYPSFLSLLHFSSCFYFLLFLSLPCFFLVQRTQRRLMHHLFFSFSLPFSSCVRGINCHS